jgi:membrane-associated phospholipid phosphatase
VSEILSPLYIVPALLLLVAWSSTQRPGETVAWGLLAIGLTMALPVAHLYRELRLGRVSDHNVRVREQRPRLLTLTVVCALLSLGVATAGGAPQDLLALLGAQAAGLLLFAFVTLLWKISFHTGVAAGAIAILALLFGPPMLALAPAVPLVGWARVELGDHTPLQVVTGAVLGAAVAAGAFSLLR